MYCWQDAEFPCSQAVYTPVTDLGGILGCALGVILDNGRCNPQTHRLLMNTVDFIANLSPVTVGRVVLGVGGDPGTQSTYTL
jgi:hypothetical protein